MTQPTERGAMTPRQETAKAGTKTRYEWVKDLIVEGRTEDEGGIRNLFNCQPETRGFIRRFSAGHNRPGGNGARRISWNDLFGGNVSFYFLTSEPERASNYLVGLFYEHNPKPSPAMRNAFTHILHENGLHWGKCYHP